MLGGARSGKSAYAEGLVEAQGPGLYVATAEAGDAEMAERIRHHKERRGNSWTTVEEPLDLAGALKANAAPDLAVLVDCLTLWLNNLMEAQRDVDAVSRVAWSDHRAGMGLQFEEVGMADQSAVDEFVDQHAVGS